MANSVDPDQTPRSVASDLGLHCLLRVICPNIFGNLTFPSFVLLLTLNAPITTSADDNFDFIIIIIQRKTSIDILCEPYAWQTIHIKFKTYLL